MRTLTPGPNQPAHDLVSTPLDLARQIVEHFRPFGRAIDPCRGVQLQTDAGELRYPFYDVMRTLPCGPETVEWCEITQGRDYLTVGLTLGAYDWVITNPPWSQFRPFLLRSMELADNVVLLGTLTHFVTKRRLRDLREHDFGVREALLLPTPPRPWPGSGFQLAAVWVKRGWTGKLKFVGEPG